MCLNILCVSPVFPPAWSYGGTPVTAHALAKAILRQGQSVFAICTGDKRDGSPILDVETVWDEVPVIYCSRRHSPIPFFSPSLGIMVSDRSAACDIALIRSTWTYVGPAASKECWAKELPYLVYPEGSFDPYALNHSVLKKTVFWHILDRPYYRRAAAIIALTSSEADNIRRMGLTNRIEVIPNGVDVENFAREVPRENLEELFPQIRERKIILFLGRIHPIKGLINLVKAFKRVHIRHPESILIIAGPDEDGYMEKVIMCVKQENLQRDVVLTGPVYEWVKIALLNNAEMFVISSFSEGFPLVLLEAMACKLPIVLTINCHVPEVAESGAGIEVETRPEPIAEALGGLLSDDRARTQMGENGYGLVRGRFSWRTVAENTIDLCSDILS